jgi:hypothetical protein
MTAATYTWEVFSTLDGFGAHRGDGGSEGAGGSATCQSR